ncbi:uncharacterized protein [Palaemon carinicauda]|uniref:uncharacterized protein n=1 Tax=Palaemon carinicauda TaxID=392227 RepID=UPI0035B65B44
MVQLLTKTFQNVAKSCRQNIVAVSQYGSVASDGTIMIATPIGIMKLLSRKEQAYSLSKVLALIIDDGLKVFTAVMNASPQDENLNELLSRTDVNKVVIDDSLTEGRVGVAAFIMKAQFKKLPADRPKKKWEPLNPAALEEEAASAAATSVKDTKKDSNAEDKEKSSKVVFKVPALPILKPKPKDNALKGKDTNSEKNEKPIRKSRFDDPHPSASAGKKEEEGKTNDALNLIMSNYKDFQKGGLNIDPPQQSSQNKEVIKEKQSTHVEPSKEKSKSLGFQEKHDIASSVLKIDAKNIPYYSTTMKSKSYASIPFNYDDSGNNTSSQPSLKGDKSSCSSATSNVGRYPGLESTKSPGSRFSLRSPTRGSRRSPSSTESRRSPSSDSRRSPTSSRSSRRSPTRDYKRSRSPQSSSKDSHSKRRTSPYGRSKYETKKSFIEAELEMKEEHAKETKLFFDVPEVHPEFENKHKIFSERYEKQYPGKLDSKHKEQRWQEFWKVIVTGMQEIAWKEKVDILKKQLKMEPEDKDSRSSNKRKTSDSRDESDSSRKSSKRENDYGFRLKPKEKSGSVERKSPSSRQNSDRSSPSRRDHSRRSGRSSIEQESSKKGMSYDGTDQDFSIGNALNLIGEVLNHLGVLKPALEIVIDRISRSGVNSKDAVSILTENDNALLIEMSYKRLESIAKTAHRGPFRNKLIKVCEETKKLKEFTALKLQEIAIAATDNAISSIKKRNEDSTVSGREMNKENQVKLTEEASNLVRGLDVNKIARATHERGTEAIIEFIKNAFAYEGIINPTPQDINEIYREVSRLHFQMSLKDAHMDSLTNTSERRQTPESFLDNSLLPSREKNDETYPIDSSLMDRTCMSALGPSSSSNNCSPSLSVKDNSNKVLASSSGVEVTSFLPKKPINENDGSSFHTRSSIQSNPSFTQGNKESPFPGGYQGYHASDSSGRDPSAFQRFNYLAQGQDSHGNQNSIDEYNELQRDPGSCVQPWNHKETDESTIDFMNQRLDYLLQDTRFQTSKLNKNLQNETEESSGFSRSDHQFSNQSNEHRQMGERFSRDERDFPNPNNEHNQMHESFGRNEQQFYDQNNEFGHRGERFGRGERQFSDQNSERESSPMDERFTMGSRQYSNQNIEFNQMEERFIRGNRQYSNQHYERGSMEERRLNMGDMSFGQRQGYEEAHDFDMESRNFNKDNFERMKHFGGHQDSCQRDFHGDREYDIQNASQYERNEPYQVDHPWKREDDEFDNERRDLRNVFRRNIEKNELEIDINSMRIRGGPPHLENQTLRGGPDSDWGQPGPHMMRQRNIQQTYPEEEEDNDIPDRTPSELHISEFLNRFR